MMSYAGLFVRILAAFISITSGSITNVDDEEKVHCRVRDLKKNCSPLNIFFLCVCVLKLLSFLAVVVSLGCWPSDG